MCSLHKFWHYSLVLQSYTQWNLVLLKAILISHKCLLTSYVYICIFINLNKVFDNGKTNKHCTWIKKPDQSPPCQIYPSQLINYIWLAWLNRNSVTQIIIARLDYCNMFWTDRVRNIWVQNVLAKRSEHMTGLLILK